MIWQKFEEHSTIRQKVQQKFDNNTTRREKNRKPFDSNSTIVQHIEKIFDNNSTEKSSKNGRFDKIFDNISTKRYPNNTESLFRYGDLRKLLIICALEFPFTRDRNYYAKRDGVSIVVPYRQSFADVCISALEQKPDSYFIE